MDDKIIVRERFSWGKLKYYPKNESAQLFCRLTKTKSLTEDMLQIILMLGYDVEFERVRLRPPSLEERRSSE